MEQVIIGVDPHKLSATIEVIDQHEKLLGSGRFTTDQAGYTAMRGYAKSWRRCQTDARAAAPRSVLAEGRVVAQPPRRVLTALAEN